MTTMIRIQQTRPINQVFDTIARRIAEAPREALKRREMEETVMESLCSECEEICVLPKDFEDCKRFQDELFRMREEARLCERCGNHPPVYQGHCRECAERAFGGSR